MATNYKTREQWLQAAIKAVTPIFKKLGETVPEVRVSVGLPSGGVRGLSTIGECWADWSTEDKVPQIYITPIMADPVKVLATLVHELIHACGHHGHGGQFQKLGKKLDMVGPMLVSLPGQVLDAHLRQLAKKLGPYPHGALHAHSGPTQSTRMIKCQCRRCGYVCRTTSKWLAVGPPLCPDPECSAQRMKVIY